MTERRTLRTIGSGAALLLVVASLLVAGAGGAAAQTSPTPTATPASTGVIANDTVAVDNDTQSVYADVEAANSSVSLEVSFIAIGPDGNESEPVTQTVDLNASAEDLIKHSEINATEDAEYRVVVETADGNSTNATAEVGTIQKVAGGGGGGLLDGGSGSTGTVAVVALLLLGGLALTGDD